MTNDQQDKISAIDRERMDVDVLIIGGGPAGLACAIHLQQLHKDKNLQITIVEKGSLIGSHILSGAVVETKALDELLPDWQTKVACQSVQHDAFSFLGRDSEYKLPVSLFPPMMHNKNNVIISLGELCRYMEQQAVALGVEIYPSMSASQLVFDKEKVIGCVVGEMGIGKDGKKKASYESGMELCAKYVVLAEGARGSLSKQVIKKYQLDEKSDPQKFGLGLKEIWQIDKAKHKAGLVKHTLGWPLDNDTGGGSFIYHYGDNLVSIGFVVHLDYANPTLSPYETFQQFKTHKSVQRMLENGKRISYGARVITEGGWQSLPKLTFPGGAVIGCAAGMVNVPRIKGTHNAVKSGMLLAKSFDIADEELTSKNYEKFFIKSEIYKELKQVRNVKPLLKKFGTFWGTMLSGFDLWVNYLFNNLSLFGTLHHKKNDAQSTLRLSQVTKITYPPHDGIISFDLLTNLSFSGTGHEEDQPIHLVLRDKNIPVDKNLPHYGEPAQFYCPAKVYEIITQNGKKEFVINAQNCLHCKTCDIKDPSENITWTLPQGGGGPNYSNM